MKDTYLQLLNMHDGIEFQLNKSQWALLSKFFKAKMESVVRKYNALGAAIVTRGSLGAVRIAETFIDHTLVIYHFSKFGSEPDVEMHKYMDFYSLLPESEFTRSDVLEIARDIGFSDRTLDRRLEKLRKSGRIESIKSGTYRKK
jgi:hypothetical protein